MIKFTSYPSGSINNIEKIRPLPSVLIDYIAMTVYDLIPLRYSLPVQLSNHCVMPELVYFIQKITFQAGIDCRTALVALIYLNRAKQSLPKGAVGGHDTCHRLFLGSILLASKFLLSEEHTTIKMVSIPSHWHHYYTTTLASTVIIKKQLNNRHLSTLSSGLFSLSEINQLERSFLKLIQYQCWVNDQDINNFIIEHRVDFSL